MPLLLIVIGSLLIITGVNGQYAALGANFEQDVLGQGQTGGGFLNFMVGLTGLAVVFRLLDMPTAGKIFITLVLIVFIMENQGVLTALENIGQTAAAGPASSATGSSGVASSAPGLSPSQPAAGTSNATPLTTPAGSGGIGSA